MQINNLDKLSLANKLSLLEQITNSILQDEEEFEAPAWHGKVLAARKSELENPETWLDLDQVIKELTQ